MKKYIPLLLLSFTPLVSFAAFGGVRDLINDFKNLVDLVIPIVAALALLAFFWGLVKFIAKAGDEKSHEEGKNIMKWGIIALFVMFSVWGLVFFIQRNLGLPENKSINGPTSQSQGSFDSNSFDPGCGAEPGQEPC